MSFVTFNYRKSGAGDRGLSVMTPRLDVESLIRLAYKGIQHYLFDGISADFMLEVRSSRSRVGRMAPLAA